MSRKRCATCGTKMAIHAKRCPECKTGQPSPQEIRREREILKRMAYRGPGDTSEVDKEFAEAYRTVFGKEIDEGESQ